MQGPLVTILVPNYKTKELTTMCLRLLRKYTDTSKVAVIVIDNDSQDDSLEYLRTLNWITLLERKAIPGESPAMGHSRALDMALELVATPFVLSIHTDTLIKHPKWLEFLLHQFSKNPRLAGVGSWKLEAKPFWRQMLKQMERYVQMAYYQVTGKKQHSLEGVGDNYFYLRSHCAMYRTNLLKKYNLHFADGDMVAGKAMHKALIDHSYEMKFLPSEVLIKYLDHINHATTILNPELSRQKSVAKGMRRIEKSLARMQSLVSDPSWDY